MLAMDDTWFPCLGDVVVNPRLGRKTKDALCAIKVQLYYTQHKIRNSNLPDKLADS